MSPNGKSNKLMRRNRQFKPILSDLKPLDTKPFSYASCGIFPNTQDDPGFLDFNVLLGNIASTKNKWTYCAELNKLYIVWHQVIPLEFGWQRGPEKLFVRALPIFTDPQYLHEPVQRCFIHLDRADPSNEGFQEIHHVLRSENPGAQYEQHPESARCSVVVPLEDPQPGTGKVTVTYKFMCKTSCVTGKTRRNMAVIFTLERMNGEVLGRRVMGVKVCSCPRRDMEKEEQMMRRKVKNEPSNSSKILYSLEIELPDVEMFKKVLEFNHGGVSSLLRTTPHDDPNYIELNDFLSILEEKLSYLSQWSN